jgi:hypothetical protein
MQQVREDMREQQPVGVDDGEPHLAHAGGESEVALREAAQDVGESVVR